MQEQQQQMMMAQMAEKLGPQAIRSATEVGMADQGEAPAEPESPQA
jgi:hypothetical protein